MPEVVTYKVRAVVEYTVIGVRGFGDAVKCAEGKITPAVKPDTFPDLDGSYVRNAKLLDVGAERE